MKVHLAAFGKHPGWDDHIEEIGLDHEDLVRIKVELYAEGIAGNIDSGAWERLGEDQRLGTFRHVFYWRRASGLVIGRIWSSRDGKGRTKYPMVVCGLVEGATDAWAVQHLLPRLEAVEGKCTQTNSAELVRLAIGEARRGIEDQVALLAAGSPSGTADEAALVKRLLASPGLSTQAEPGVGALRVMYEIEREMSEYRSMAGAKRTASRLVSSSGAQHIRVPRCLDGAGEGARAWLTLLAQELADSVPVLVIEPLGGTYVDIIVGEPKPPQFFCVRANEKGLALTSEVPYTIDDAFKQSAGAKVKAWSEGKIRVPGVRGGSNGSTPQPSAAGDSDKRGKGILIAAGVGIGAIVLAGVLYAVLSGKDTPAPDPKTQAQTQEPNAQAPTPAPNKANGQAPDSKPTVAPKPTIAYVADDPRSSWGLDTAVARVTAMLDTLDIEQAAGGEKVDQELRARLTRAVERADKFVRGRAFSAATRDAIARDMASVDGEVDGVSQDVGKALEGSYAKVAGFLKGEIGQPQVSMPVLKEAWASGLRSIDPKQGWENARKKHAALARGLKDSEAALQVASRITAPAISDANAPALQAALDAKIEEAAHACAEGALAGDTERAKAAAAGYASWAGHVSTLFGKSKRLSDLFAAGYAAGEATTDGATIGTLRGELEKSPAWKEMGGSLGGLTSRCDALEALAKGQDAAALMNAVKSARPDLAKLRLTEAMTACQRLGELKDWPASRGDVEGFAALVSDEFRPMIARVGDAPRREVLTQQVAATGRKVWGTFAATQATNAEGVAAVLATQELLGVGQAAVDALPEWARYNLARGRLEHSVASAGTATGAARGQALKDAMAAFLKTTEPMAVAKSGEAAALRAAIAELGQAGGEIDLSKLGPGSTGWSVTKSDPESVTYSQGGMTLEFRRVEGEGEGVSFVATTEVAVGQFIEMVGSRGEEFRAFLPKSDAGGVDPRTGPRTWVWSGSNLTMAKEAGPGDLAKGWVRIKTQMAGREYYPGGVNVGPVTAEHPMQYLSPKAALFAARLSGCRLPTPSEWKGAGGVAAGGNLRDATWKKVHDHLMQFAQSGPEFPGAGIFWPTGVTRRSPLDDAQPAVTTDDGVVWFAPVVGTGAGFQHLNGNVAEYAFEDGPSWDAVAATKDAVDAAVGRGEKVRVIGGSALSPAEIKLDQAYPVSASQSREGFSDVGFRLAFSAPKGAMAAGTADRLKTALAAGGYLKGESRK